MEKKTLADLKRDLVQGTEVIMTFNSNNSERIQSYLNIPRYIVKVQSNGIYISENNEALSGSWLEFPKASRMSFTGTVLDIFDDKTGDLSLSYKVRK